MKISNLFNNIKPSFGTYETPNKKVQAQIQSWFNDVLPETEKIKLQKEFDELIISQKDNENSFIYLDSSSDGGIAVKADLGSGKIFQYSNDFSIESLINTMKKINNIADENEIFYKK